MSGAAVRCDVVVAGGGPAGIAAALGAASLGADVLLLERAPTLGGNVSQAFVHTICGLFLPSHEHRATHAHPGLPREFAAAMREAGAAGDVEWAGSAGYLAIDPEAFAGVALRLCAASGRVDVRTGAVVSAVHAGSACTVEFAADGQTARSSFVIDATGDATAARLAGVATEAAPPDVLQHASCIARIDGADAAALDGMERARTTAAVARAAKRGELPATAGSVVLRPALRPGSFWLTVNRPKPAGLRFDPLDRSVLARLDADARADATAILAFLRAGRSPFASAVFGAWPARPGIRETHRVRGVERLEAADVLEGRRREDEACVTTWPIELWNSHERLSFRHAAGPASIPLGCLVADHPSRRIAAAGRCASASHEALGAIRVIATSMAMGEAAGVACALAARAGSDLSAVEPADVRRAIASAGKIAFRA